MHQLGGHRHGDSRLTAAVFLAPSRRNARSASGAAPESIKVTNDDTLNGLAKRLADAIPQNLRTAHEDIERNFRSVLSSGLGKMNLVSREEFDVQAAVLKRTRERLEALEASLADLEQGLSDD